MRGQVTLKVGYLDFETASYSRDAPGRVQEKLF
jgi:hypothetical protein